jgi:hypothetical protein
MTRRSWTSKVPDFVYLEVVRMNHIVVDEAEPRVVFKVL